MKIVIASGGFDPIHAGHVALLEDARSHGDMLIAGVNSDDWLIRKKWFRFIPLKERMTIVRALSCVEEVVWFDDDDNTACDLLVQVKNRFPNDTIIFANGGDRTQENIPEMSVQWIEFIFWIGGDFKMNSSSSLLQEFADYVVSKQDH